MKTKIAILLSLVMIIASLFAVTAFNVSAEDAEIVPDYNSSSVTTNACQVFAKGPNDTEFTWVNSHGTLVTALNTARNQLLPGGAYEGGTAWIYIKSDLSKVGDNNFNTTANINGTLVIDFANHSINTQDRNYLLGFYANSGANAASATYTTNVKIMNATIQTYRARPVINLQGDTKAPYTGTKNFNVSFDNVTFKRASTDVTDIIMVEAGGTWDGNQRFNANVSFNNCTFDYDGATSLTLVKDATGANDGGDYVKVTTTVTGASTMEAPSYEKFAGLNTVGTEDSIAFAPDSLFTFKYTATPVSGTILTTEGEMHFASEHEKVSSSTVTYSLSNNYIDGYGYLPTAANGKTFSVFANGYHIGSYNDYNASNNTGALHRVKVMVSSGGLCVGGTATIVLNKDYQNKSSNYANFAQVDGTIVVDLNGHTFTHASNYMFDAQGKTSSGVLTSTNVIVKNGNLVLNANLIRATSASASGSTLYSGTKEFSFTFDNVSFTNNGKALVELVNFVGSETNDKKFNVDININNSTFTTAAATLMNLSASEFVSGNITFNGGKIVTDDMNALTLAVAAENNNATADFGKLDGGVYTTLELPKEAEAPLGVYYDENGTEYMFVKSFENEETVNYILREKAIVTFVPKTSITLGSELVYNVYVPASSALTSFTVGETTYTEFDLTTVTIDGEDYYLVSVTLGASEAAKNIVFAATLNIGDTTASGSWTLSIPKYATKVLSSDATETEKTLVKDVLAYINSAYLYFNKTTVNAIDEILGEEYKGTLVNDAEETDATVGLKGATLVLDAKPALRFYLADNADKTAYKFYIGGSEVTATEGTDKIGAYLEVSLYAYKMCETVTYTIDDEVSGSYNVGAYYKNASEGTDALLTALVENFWIYCQSAKAYKTEVTAK